MKMQIQQNLKRTKWATGIFCGMLLSSAAWAQNAARTEASKSHPQIREDSTQVGAKLGMTKVEQLGDPVMTYGAFADYAVGDNLLVGGSLDYWNKSTGTLADTSVQVSDLTGAVSGKYVFTDVKTSFRPFAVAALAVHRFAVSESKDSSGQIDKLSSKYKDIEGEFGIDYGAGAMYRVQKSMDVVGEVRYRSILDSGVSLSQLAFTGGLGYVM